MKKTTLVVALLAAAALAGCDRRADYGYAQQPQYATAPAPAQYAPAAAPVIVNQQPANSGVGDMLMGGALGYMLGRGSGGSGGDVHRTTVNKTVVNKTVIVQNNHPTPAAAPAPVSTPSRGFGSGYSAAYASKPAAPSRSSFGGYSSARSSFGSSSFSRSSSFGRRR